MVSNKFSDLQKLLNNAEPLPDKERERLLLELELTNFLIDGVIDGPGVCQHCDMPLRKIKDGVYRCGCYNK